MALKQFTTNGQPSLIYRLIILAMAVALLGLAFSNVLYIRREAMKSEYQSYLRAIARQTVLATRDIRENNIQYDNYLSSHGVKQLNEVKKLYTVLYVKNYPQIVIVFDRKREERSYPGRAAFYYDYSTSTYS